MILEEITIKNWRGYREPHTFQFQNGINLVVGRNEVGKSTIFEAMTRALFDRFNSKTEEIRAIQPMGSSLGPEVSVRFRVDGKKYKVVKRFLQDPKSELFLERQGKWELDHEGDAADSKLRDILRGEGTTRTAARPEHRGLAQALWYLQSDGSIPEKEWNEGVKHGLQGLVQETTRSPQERLVLHKLETAYSQYWTPTGRIVANSELGRLQEGIPGVEETLSHLQEKARTVDGYRGDLEEFHEMANQKKRELVQATKELSELQEQVSAAEKITLEKEAKERDINELCEKAQRLQQELIELQDKQQKIVDRKQDFKDLETSLDEVAVNARLEAVESERHARRWKEELEPTLQQIETELRSELASLNLTKLNKDRERLEKHLISLKEIRKQLDEKSEERAAFIAPDVKENKGFAKISEELSVLDAKIEASAVKVAFEFEDKRLKVTTQPQLGTSDNGEFLVTEPTEFHVQDVGKIRVRSGAQALKDLISKREETKQKLQAVLIRYKVEDAEGLATLLEKGRELDRAISKLKDRLKEIIDAEPDAEEELNQVKRSIHELKPAFGQFVSNPLERDGISEKERIATLENEKERLIKEIDKEQDLEKRSGKKHLDFIKSHEKISNSLAGLRAQINIYTEGVEKTLEFYGTLANLKQQSVDSQEKLEKIKDSLSQIMQSYEERVETPQRLYTHAETRVKELRNQIQDLQTKLAGMMARIEEASSQGNYSQLADTEIELEQKRRRVVTLQRRADAVKLLRDLVYAYEKERSAVLSGPVEDQMNRWLSILTEGNYDSLSLDESIKPVGVHVSRYGAVLPMSSLSHGAQEQVVVLLRLSIGVLVSKDEPNLVIIDDRLVNADPVRMKRLCLILQEAAKTCQVVLATCNDTPYAGIGASLIRVPTDGVKAEK